jgi:hypothetical protein
MIGPSDLNRIPPWMPARLPEDLRRYVRSELGAEDLGTHAAKPPAGAVRGLRVWLATRVRPARATAGPSLARPLGTGLGAVHFAGEMDRKAPQPVPVFATQAMVFSTPAKAAGSDELGICDP